MGGLNKKDKKEVGNKTFDKIVEIRADIESEKGKLNIEK